MGDKSVELGDQVFFTQTKSTTKPPLNPNPYKVVDITGNNATLEIDGRKIKRCFNQLKVLKIRLAKRKVKRVS